MSILGAARNFLLAVGRGPDRAGRMVADEIAAWIRGLHPSIRTEYKSDALGNRHLAVTVDGTLSAEEYMKIGYGICVIERWARETYNLEIPLL